MRTSRRPNRSPIAPRNIGEAIAASLEASLRRLGRGSVDLFQLHNPITRAGQAPALSPEAVLAEAVPALERLRAQGKARWFGITALGVYGIVLGGWSSGSTYSLLGGLRSSAQMISYEVAMGLSLVAVFLYAGSMSTSQIVAAQENLWYGLILIPSFVIYTIAMVGFAVVTIYMTVSLQQYGIS